MTQHTLLIEDVLTILKQGYDPTICFTHKILDYDTLFEPGTIAKIEAYDRCELNKIAIIFKLDSQNHHDHIFVNLTDESPFIIIRGNFNANS